MKRKLIVVLTVLFFDLSLAFPGFIYDPWLEYIRLKTHYSKMQQQHFNALYVASHKYKISIDELAAIVQSESEWNERAVSHANARGLMQVMPFNYDGDVNDLFNPEINCDRGASYYLFCLRLAKGDRKVALRYYNAGPASIASNYRNWEYIRAIRTNTFLSERVDMKKYLTIY
jgi:soluble lytic murein transglycosylase-like protein